jgi:hypothetical protein
MTPHETHADLLAEITALRERVASIARALIDVAELVK